VHPNEHAHAIYRQKGTSLPAHRGALAGIVFQTERHTIILNVLFYEFFT
jgi:hypothetical protein